MALFRVNRSCLRLYQRRSGVGLIPAENVSCRAFRAIAGGFFRLGAPPRLGWRGLFVVFGLQNLGHDDRLSQIERFVRFACSGHCIRLDSFGIFLCDSLLNCVRSLFLRLLFARLFGPESCWPGFRSLHCALVLLPLGFDFPVAGSDGFPDASGQQKSEDKYAYYAVCHIVICVCACCVSCLGPSPFGRIGVPAPHPRQAKSLFYGLFPASECLKPC